jgi:hypothetical protein
LKYVVFEDHKTAILEAMIGKFLNIVSIFVFVSCDLSAIVVVGKLAKAVAMLPWPLLLT